MSAGTGSYDLFNPAPPDKLRSFCSDRPTKSNGPCTVDAGHFQYETDILNWTYDATATTVQNSYLFTNPTFKLGLTDKLDIEANIAPVQEVTTRDKTTGNTSRMTGVGDLYLRVKYNLIGNAGGDIAAALFPYVKIPTAPPGLGNKAVEEGLIVPVTFTLPKGFSLSLDPEADILKNANDNRYHANYQGVADVSHSIFSDSITGYVELWSDVNDDPSGTVTQASFDAALAWLARPDLQLDAGANIGLNSATPDFQAYFGISQRF